MFYEDEHEKPMVVKIGSIEIEQLNSWEPDRDPLDEDYISMGTSLGTNVMMLHMPHPRSDPAEYITLVHIPTGERIRITFPYEEE